LIFLVFALYRGDYLRRPEIISVTHLCVSFLFLFAGFFINAVAWKKSLEQSDYRVRFDHCLAGFGLSIFGKYIPGKIWMLMGRAAYITEKSDLSLGALSAVSLNMQFIAIWVGLVFGLAGMCLLDGWHLWGWLILLLWLLFTIIIFSHFAHARIEYILRTALRKEVKIPRLSPRATVSVMPWFMAYWSFWSMGFCLLVASLIRMEPPWSVGFGFTLAATLGIMTFISPGGLGTREAIMIGYLALAGIPVVDATTVAVASRLWFLGGEVFIFLLGWAAHKRIVGLLN
jgi:uncharacterized membrane protein YbhN (UPF0104 family)